MSQKITDFFLVGVELGGPRLKNGGGESLPLQGLPDRFRVEDGFLLYGKYVKSSLCFHFPFYTSHIWRRLKNLDLRVSVKICVPMKIQMEFELPLW
jgi:hypothetical protein